MATEAYDMAEFGPDGLALALRLFTMLTPGIDEVEELKKGNMGVAVVVAAVILSMGGVIAMTVMGAK